MQQEAIREVVGVFDSIQNLDEAIADLETIAFPRHDISVLGRGRAPAEAYTGPASVEDNPDAPRAILIRPEEETIGIGVLIGGGMYAGAVTALLVTGGSVSLAAFLYMLAGAAFGGVLGGVIAWLLGRYYERIFNEQIRQGGTVLWVRAQDPGAQALATRIMNKHGARRVHVHELMS